MLILQLVNSFLNKTSNYCYKNSFAISTNHQLEEKFAMWFDLITTATNLIVKTKKKNIMLNITLLEYQNSQGNQVPWCEEIHHLQCVPSTGTYLYHHSGNQQNLKITQVLQITMFSPVGSEWHILAEHKGNKPPKTTRTYFTSRELKISQAGFSGEDMAIPTVAMCVLFHVLLSTMTVRLAIAVVW